jgi:hypothetical protein
MATIEIAQSEWTAALDAFSKENPGRLATIQVVSPDVGVQESVAGVPFVGISTDRKGSEAGSITIILGGDPDDQMEHLITGVTHLWIRTDEDPARAAVDIEAQDGSKTILQLSTPPELPA